MPYFSCNHMFNQSLKPLLGHDGESEYHRIPLDHLFFSFYHVEIPRPGEHFNFICTGVCGHSIGKLTHPQTKAGPSINKNRPIRRLFIIEIELQ